MRLHISQTRLSVLRGCRPCGTGSPASQSPHAVVRIDALRVGPVRTLTYIPCASSPASASTGHVPLPQSNLRRLGGKTTFATAAATTNGSTPRAAGPDGDAGISVSDGNIKDATFIFDSCWEEQFKKRGTSGMVLPREIVWLAGAPGASKGTMAGFISKERDIDSLFEVSSLLKTPEMEKRKREGILISDRDVVAAVLEELLSPRHRQGVIVDGFPRTKVQAQCIVLLAARQKALWESTRGDLALRDIIRRPVFSIAVFYVDEGESVRRQMQRGEATVAANRIVADTGFGEMHAVRATDTSEAAARARYKVFREEVYGALQQIKDVFPFRFINAVGNPHEVQALIRAEFAYQSSQELSEDAYALVTQVPDAASVVKQARADMVQRLSGYALDHRELFNRVTSLVASEFVHIFRQQALMGRAIVRTMHPLLSEPGAVNILLDVLAERGYTVALDVVRSIVPSRLIPASDGVACQEGDLTLWHHNALHISTGGVMLSLFPGLRRGPGFIVSSVTTTVTYVFDITWPRPTLRRKEVDGTRDAF